MPFVRRRFAALAAWMLPLVLTATSAWAQKPEPWEMDWQPAFSPVKQDIIDLNWFVLAIITLITALVAGLLAWVLWRYRASRNPVPSQVSHNTVLEVAWTTLPILILVAIAIPSFRLLYYQDRTRDPQLTLKVTAHQWYWEYEYPEQGNLDINSRMVPYDQLKAGQLRMLSVDNPLVLPVGKNIRILETSSDVIHSFFIPSLGVQRYAIPGQTIETWTRITAPGTYYGECNQICGTGHSQMPIEVRAVTVPEFEAWAKKTKAEQDNADAAPAPAGAAPRLAALGR